MSALTSAGVTQIITPLFWRFAPALDFFRRGFGFASGSLDAKSKIGKKIPDTVFSLSSVFSPKGEILKSGLDKTFLRAVLRFLVVAAVSAIVIFCSSEVAKSRKVSKARRELSARDLKGASLPAWRVAKNRETFSQWANRAYSGPLFS